MALKMPYESSSCSPCWEQNRYRRFGLWVKKVDKQTKLAVGSRIRENVLLRFLLLEEWIRLLTITGNKGVHTHKKAKLQTCCQQIGQETKLGSAGMDRFVFYPLKSIGSACIFFFSYFPLLKLYVNLVYRATIYSWFSLDI